MGKMVFDTFDGFESEPVKKEKPVLKGEDWQAEFDRINKAIELKKVEARSAKTREEMLRASQEMVDLVGQLSNLR
jgi:hypothetical protein